MLANSINAIVVVIVALIGSRLNRWFKKELTDSLMKAIGLFVLYLGITNLYGDVNSIALLISLFIGVTIGTLLDLDSLIDKASLSIQKKLSKGKDSNLAKSATVFFLASCSGAYTIVSCFNAGSGDSSMLWTKVFIDLVVGLAMATSMGIGVGLSSIPIFIYQTALILLSSVLAPLMNDAMLAILGCMGGLFTMAIGLNMLEVCNFKVANYIPAMFIAPFIVLLF